MFFELNDGTIINKHWLNNVFIDENDNTKVEVDVSKKNEKRSNK